MCCLLPLICYPGRASTARLGLCIQSTAWVCVYSPMPAAPLLQADSALHSAGK
jgi:hypothetical protein